LTLNKLRELNHVGSSISQICKIWNGLFIFEFFGTSKYNPCSNKAEFKAEKGCLSKSTIWLKYALKASSFSASRIGLIFIWSGCGNCDIPGCQIPFTETI